MFIICTVCLIFGTIIFGTKINCFEKYNITKNSNHFMTKTKLGLKIIPDGDSYIYFTDTHYKYKGQNIINFFSSTI